MNNPFKAFRIQLFLRLFLPLLLPLLALLFIAPLFAGCGGAGAGTSSTGARKAPDFSVQTILGSHLTSGDVKGKPIVLNFGASWCGPCNEEAPMLAAMYNRYKDRVTFVGMAVKDKPDDQRAFAQKYGLAYTIGLDPKGDNLYNYQQAAIVPYSGIPTTFFIDAKGDIVSFYIGPMSQSEFEQKLSGILN